MEWYTVSAVYMALWGKYTFCGGTFKNFYRGFHSITILQGCVRVNKILRYIPSEWFVLSRAQFVHYKSQLWLALALWRSENAGGYHHYPNSHAMSSFIENRDIVVIYVHGIIPVRENVRIRAYIHYWNDIMCLGFLGSTCIRVESLTQKWLPTISKGYDRTRNHFNLQLLNFLESSDYI